MIKEEIKNNEPIEKLLIEKINGLDKSMKKIIELLKPNNFIKVYSTSVTAVKTSLNFKTDTQQLPIYEINILNNTGILTLYLNSSEAIIAENGDKFTGEFYSIEYTQTVAAGKLILQTRIDK